MKRTLLAAALAAASLAIFAQSPGSPGMGQGMGQGMGPGMGPGAGGCCGANVTPGWAMMTPEERTQHQEKMHGMKDYAQCQAYATEHQKLMQERAKERGQPLPSVQPGAACQGFKKPG